LGNIADGTRKSGADLEIRRRSRCLAGIGINENTDTAGDEGFGGDAGMNITITRLSNLCKVITKGTTPTSIGLKFSDNGIVFLRVQNINNGKVNYEQQTLFIDEFTHKALARSQILAGEVLVSIAGTIGRAGIVPDNAPPLNCNQAVAIVRTNENIFRPYLRHWLESNDAQSQIIGATVTGTISNLSLTQIGNLQFPLPPLEEQRRIAEILDRAKELRSKRREAIAQLDTLTQAIFIEMFGDPATNPKEWTVSKLGDIAEKITDGEHQTPKRTLQGIKLLSARNVQNGYIDVRDVDYVSIKDYQRIMKRCNPGKGDILLSCSGTIGRVTTVDTDELFSLVRSVALLKLKHDLINSKFLEYFLRTPALHAKMQQRANASSQANLFQNQIRELPTFIPPLTLQKEFAQRVEAVEKLKASHRASLSELNALFASLQHRAFRGEL